jgi:hypothetical protein
MIARRPDPFQEKSRKSRRNEKRGRLTLNRGRDAPKKPSTRPALPLRIDHHARAPCPIHSLWAWDVSALGWARAAHRKESGAELVRVQRVSNLGTPGFGVGAFEGVTGGGRVAAVVVGKSARGC